MTLRYLLDTNIISELARRQPAAPVYERVLSLQDRCAIAAPTVEELHFGVCRLPAGKRKQLLALWLDDILAGFDVLPYCGFCARWLGEERARLAKAGIAAPRTDAEIASVAVNARLVLVTRNINDFRYFNGLEAENWFL